MTVSSEAAVSSPSGHALYVFGIADTARVTANSTGMNGGDHLELIPFRNLVAVVTMVRVGDFCGPLADARLKDPIWIGVHARHHETVVEQVMRTSPIVPARLATLFSSRQQLVAWLSRHHATLTATLEDVAGRDEWAVKVGLEKPKAEARLLDAALARERAATSPGARYLKEQQLRARVGQELDVWLKQVCDRAAAELVAHAARFRERGVFPGSWLGDGVGILNWAFLVARPKARGFEATVRRLTEETGDQGLMFASSGPWPPYSFCPPLEPTDG